MRYLLTFYAVDDEWMALSESERGAGIADIGQWFAEHARAGKIVEGHRLRCQCKRPDGSKSPPPRQTPQTIARALPMQWPSAFIFDLPWARLRW